ncbi:MAG: hypothetical protein IV085_06340 [Thiobacillus sp.]|nr:hypothetical protein [Thiobacillus sp.]
MSNNHQVLVGAVGWDHPHWRNGFYPADLPEDWMLSYYNTEFQTVYLPASVWQATADSTWTQWLFDSQEGFCFVLEAAAEGAAKPASERLLLATPRWEQDHVWWLDDSSDMRALAQRITRQAAAGIPLFVLSRAGDLGVLQQVNSLKQVMGY